MKEIKLTQGKMTLVDDEDFKWLNQWNWHLKKGRKTFYACRTVRVGTKKEHIKMNRLILGVTDSKILVDHIDRNGLNNQRVNLRTSTHSQNGANACCKGSCSSEYLGVSWHKSAGKWEVHIKKDYVNKYLGLFKDEKEAAKVYNNAAIELHGEFANLNVI